MRMPGSNSLKRGGADADGDTSPASVINGVAASMPSKPNAIVVDEKLWSSRWGRLRLAGRPDAVVAADGADGATGGLPTTGNTKWSLSLPL